MQLNSMSCNPLLTEFIPKLIDFVWPLGGIGNKAVHNTVISSFWVVMGNMFANSSLNLKS